MFCPFCVRLRCSQWWICVRILQTAANSVIEKRSPPAHGYIRAVHVTKSLTVSVPAAADNVTHPQRPHDDLLQMLYRHGKYVCQLCGKRMPRERDLKAHLASKHFMAKDFCCKLCGAEYGYKYNLQQHMKIKHRVHLSDVAEDFWAMVRSSRFLSFCLGTGPVFSQKVGIGVQVGLAAGTLLLWKLEARLRDVVAHSASSVEVTIGAVKSVEETCQFQLGTVARSSCMFLV